MERVQIRESQVSQDLQDHKDHKESEDHQDTMVGRADKVTLAQLGKRAKTGPRDLSVLRENWGQRVQRSVAKCKFLTTKNVNYSQSSPNFDNYKIQN